MTILRSGRLFLSFLVLMAIGCGPTEISITKKSSYADLVVIYNAEVQALDSLQTKVKSLKAEYSENAQAEALKSMMSSLESAGKQSIPSNPNEALDRAISAAETQSDLLKKLDTSSGSKSPAAYSEYPEEWKRKLADLDSEIARQQERVNRARDARDAAEAK